MGQDSAKQCDTLQRGMCGRCERIPCQGGGPGVLPQEIFLQI